MPSSSYFRQQAERCLRLARECTDGTVAERLRQMAAEFLDQVEQLRLQQPDFSQQPPRNTGIRANGIDRD